MDLVSTIEIARKIADIIAIPFFILIIYYFLSLPNRNSFTNLLLIFAIIGLFLDTLFTTNLIYGLLTKN